ncbi:hypothetical protein V8G56_10810 [Gaetbulibacter aquiaggeris]|uniref:Uncharacterized protein n=1 Tax=Gaetbulibacter aquiaggeris TaxID=1735373 RepID=A0ABW7MTU3_9FLAO
MIDHVVISIKFQNDLTINEYGILKDCIRLGSPVYHALRNIKLLVYLQNIGALSEARNLTENLLSFGQQNTSIKEVEDYNVTQNRYLKFSKFS